MCEAKETIFRKLGTKLETLWRCSRRRNLPNSTGFRSPPCFLLVYRFFAGESTQGFRIDISKTLVIRVIS